MGKINYNLYEDQTWFGEFFIELESEEIVKFSGKLTYQKNRISQLEVISLEPLCYDIFAEELKETGQISFSNGTHKDKKFDVINGVASCQKTGKIFRITLIKCCVYTSPLSNKSQIYFDYALLTSGNKFFDKNDNKLTVEYSFNNWPEFNHPQGFKEVYVHQQDDFKIGEEKNNKKISFIHNVSGSFINESNIFDQFLFADHLEQEEEKEINKKLINALNGNFDKVFLKNHTTHIWSILVDGMTIDEVGQYAYYLKNLLTCLTYDFKTSLESVAVIQSDFRFQVFSSARFGEIKTKDFRYGHHFGPITKKSLSKEEWEKVLDNLLYKKKNLLDNFFFVLQENYLTDSAITPFTIARTIDCLSAIGEIKGINKNEKYQKVVSCFLNDLEEPNKSRSLEFIDEQLDWVEIEETSSDKDKMRGMKISALRALSVHPVGKNQKMDLGKSYKLNQIFELIIIDHIFEELEVPDHIRKKYKTENLNPLV